MGLDIVPVKMAKPLYVPVVQAGAEKAGENSSSSRSPNQKPAAASTLENVK
jgi:hypothetical protein